MKEAQIQKVIVDYLNTVLPSSYRCFAIPNASQRTATGRPANAVAGLTRGVPDLAIVGGVGRVFFLEVKAAKGRLSEYQKEFGDWCAFKGQVPWACVHSVEETRHALCEWQIVTREVAYVKQC